MLLKRTIPALEIQKHGSGEYFSEYMECEFNDTFKGMNTSWHQGSFFNQSAFLQALIDNLASGLNKNVSLDGDEDMSALLSKLDVADSKR